MRIRSFTRGALCAGASALFLFLGGCAGTEELYREIERHASAGNYEEAIGILRESRSQYGEKDAVLYHMEAGALFHYAGLSDSSTAYLLAAERQIEDLYTKSISLGALSFVLNDRILPYDGEDFERVLLNVFLALNFARRGQHEEALVEARKVDLKLRDMTNRYEGKNTYKEDAFARLLAGVLYENEGEINDAFISYRKAFEAYEWYAKEYGTQPPRFLLNDLVRTANRLGFDEEEDAFKTLGGVADGYDEKTTGSILVVVYAGKAPLKEEHRPTVTIPDSAGVLHTFQIALPVFVPRHPLERSYRVRASGATDTVNAETDVAEDITAIAAKCLEDRLSLIYLKSGGRAVLKFLAAEKAKKEIADDKGGMLKNILASVAIDAVIAATEQADTRSWRALPAQIQLARLFVPSGTYAVNVVSSDGRPTLTEQLRVRPGRTAFAVVATRQ